MIQESKPEFQCNQERTLPSIDRSAHSKKVTEYQKILSPITVYNWIALELWFGFLNHYTSSTVDYIASMDISRDLTKIVPFTVED